ncbi:MAG: hypothetical protein FJY17_04775 [Bacteroidetes bacterium]|nr:hypothetical protein [Bacteroidota bacterium]
MTLPKLDVPIYETTLPSGTKVSFRPFLVKEEKILLMAAQSKDDAAVLKAIIQILTNCVQESIKITALPIYDIEFLFLQLRARSVGEIVDLRYRCNKKDETGKSCGTSSEYQINMLEIQPTKNPLHNNKIQLTPQIGVILRPPKFDLVNKFDKQKDHNAAEFLITMLEDCIESIFDQDTVYYTKDVPKEEVQQFVDSLNPAQQKLISQYFETMPKITYTLHFSCPKCGHKEDIVLQGINHFFK